MPISYDNQDAYAFWHCMHLAMFTGLPLAFKDVITVLFLSFFSLSFSPPSLHVDLSTCRTLELFVFFPGLLLPLTVILCLSPLYFFKRFVFPPRPSFYSLSLCFCYVYSHHFYVRHKNNRLFSHHRKPFFQTS